MIYHLSVHFFLLLPIAIWFLYGLKKKCLSHVKLALYTTCANGSFFTHTSISQTGRLPHRGQQTSSSISWVWRPPLSRIRSVCASQAAATPSSACNTQKSGSNPGGRPGQRCQSAAREPPGLRSVRGPQSHRGLRGLRGLRARPSPWQRPSPAPPSAPPLHRCPIAVIRGENPGFYWTVFTLINASGTRGIARPSACARGTAPALVSVDWSLWGRGLPSPASGLGEGPVSRGRGRGRGWRVVRTALPLLAALGPGCGLAVPRAARHNTATARPNSSRPASLLSRAPGGQARLLSRRDRPRCCRRLLRRRSGTDNGRAGSWGSVAPPHYGAG